MFSRNVMVIIFSYELHTQPYADNLTSNSNCSTGDLKVSGMTKHSDSETIEGSLELCYNKNWFSVKYDYYYRFNKDLVCQSLGYGVNPGKNCQ